jgi:hypothetical protein
MGIKGGYFHNSRTPLILLSQERNGSVSVSCSSSLPALCFVIIASEAWQSLLQPPHPDCFVAALLAKTGACSATFQGRAIRPCTRPKPRTTFFALELCSLTLRTPSSVSLRARQMLSVAISVTEFHVPVVRPFRVVALSAMAGRHEAKASHYISIPAVVRPFKVAVAHCLRPLSFITRHYSNLSSHAQQGRL